ncbi:hypothetical protein Q3G72_030295 [Acer saccharum]|nr:hypothetical protein Q3G72_030295 [Acer saccharum]
MEMKDFYWRSVRPPMKLLDPHPTVVAEKLLARKKYIDNGKQFNMIACSWIQFMIHDWIDHLEDTKQLLNSAYLYKSLPVELTAPNEISSSCPLKSFKFYKTKRVPTASPLMMIGSLNTRTPWWDGSVIYGNNDEGMRRARTFKDGKLKIAGDGLLEHDEKMIPISGDVRNCWAGFSLLQALFVKEHNAVGDMLKGHYSDLDDEKLYRHARLVTSAVIAKIHTIDWTVELLKTDTLLAGMRINCGLVGLKKPRDHGAPYSLTEEFVGVYRMHSLLPDKLIVHDIKLPKSKYECPLVLEEVPMMEMAGKEGERRLSKIGMEQILQRGVARYNEFRRNSLMIPINKWEDLTDDVEAIEALQEVYGDDVEKLDLQVGLHAEKKIKRFAISETAFFIFLLIASRRLEADRFFTTNFNSQTYTEEGLKWVNNTETLKDVIDRHFPDMTRNWMRCSSAFSVWDSAPNPANYIPLYLRLGP